MKQSILVVDDDQRICDLLTDYFESEGYAVQSALTIKDAKRKLITSRLPNILILDVMLPDGNGLALLKLIRQTPRTKLLPVILITAHYIKTQDKIRGFEFGADDYMPKPFDLRELRLRMSRILKRNGGHHQAPPVPRKPNVSADKAAEILSSIIKPPEAPIQASPAAPASSPLKPAPPPKKLQKNRFDFFQRWVTLLLDFKTIIKDRDKQIDSRFVGFFFGLFAMGFGLQNGVFNKSFGIGITSLFAFSILSAGSSGALAWIYHWFLGLRQKSVPLKQLFFSFSMFWAPMALSGILGLIYVAVARGNPGDFTGSLLLVFPNQASSFVGFLLRRFDFFEIWGLLLVGESLCYTLRVKRKKVLRWLFGSWILLIIALGLVRGVF